MTIKAFDTFEDEEDFCNGLSDFKKATTPPKKSPHHYIDVIHPYDSCK